MGRDVYPSDLERGLRKLNRIDLRLWKAKYGQNRATSRAGAKMERRVTGITLRTKEDSRRQTVRCREFAEERARHDRPLVDIERHAAHIHARDQMAAAYGADTPVDQRAESLQLRCRDGHAGTRFDMIGIDVQRLADPDAGLRNRIEVP